MEGVATEQQLRQRVYASDGSFDEFTVDTYEFHPTHAHFHYKNFGQAFLYRLNPDGTLEKVRESRKNGFCMIDVENTRFGLDDHGLPYKGEAPRTYYFPRCNAPTERDEHGTYMVNGISVGWADVYNWFLADQYIEISGVPDGLYVIETMANPIRHGPRDQRRRQRGPGHDPPAGRHRHPRRATVVPRPVLLLLAFGRGALQRVAGDRVGVGLGEPDVAVGAGGDALDLAVAAADGEVRDSRRGASCVPIRFCTEVGVPEVPVGAGGDALG